MPARSSLHPSSFILHPFSELHVKSNFSFLEGASHPEEFVRRAAELRYPALAITDRNSLAGVVRAHAAAKEAGVKLIVGAEITPADAAAVVLWAPDRAAYGRLARLITRGRGRAEKGDCRLTLVDVAELSSGLLAGVVPRRNGDQSQSDPKLLRELNLYRDIFGSRCRLLAELHYGPDDQGWAQRLLALSRQSRLPLVAAGDAHYHAPERGVLHDVLVAVRHRCTVHEARPHLFANHERHLHPADAMCARFAFAPEAVRRTQELVEQCTFSLDELRYEYPEELAPPGETPRAYLERLTLAGAARRYPQGVPDKVRSLLAHELKLIGELRYEAYFLTVWDLVRFARQRGILCQGRGSAANSAVCYCLGVTAVDPDRSDVLFERFISRQRNEAPDIDVDFEHERREEVLQYIYEKYGRERAGMTAEVIVYRPRSAVRDVSKALGIPAERSDALAKSLEHYHHEPALAERCREAGIDPDVAPGSQLVELVDTLVGFPRHLSQHTGGMVITRGPLCELVPIENAAMAGRTVIEWNKDDLDELGILKVDCLCLGMLTAIRKCFALVRRHAGRTLTLAGIPEGDTDVYAMIRRADTVGVFQIESRAQMSMLPRLQPRSFYDLVIEVAIVRPGPIQGNMVHPYLRRRNGEEPVEYPSDAIRAVLEKTLGVPLFQEQAMRLAVVAAGFTPGEADQLRRAMAAWRRPGLIDAFRRKLIEGMTARGLSQPYAEAVFQQLRGFGEYGFPESHAASFALLVYVSAWLKWHYPAAFAAALLNSQPMGFYAPAQLVRDARQHGVEVRPVDVNASEVDCTVELMEEGQRHKGTKAQSLQEEARVSVSHWDLDISHSPSLDSVPLCLCASAPLVPSAAAPSPLSLRLGFRMIAGLSHAHAEQIVAARGARLFTSLEDFSRRTGVGSAVTVRLAEAGAFDVLRLDRRAAVWHALAQNRRELPLFDHLPTATEERPAALPALSAPAETLADYRTLGLSLRAHPLSFLRDDLARLRVVPAAQLAQLPNGQPVRVAGIVLVRQRPGTAKGITFVTLEDETGQVNLIIRMDVWNKFRAIAQQATLLLASGRLQQAGGVIHVLVGRLEDYSRHLQGLAAPARNFC